MYDVTKDIKYVGVNDPKADFFEGQYVLEKGMAFNSYVILDEKIAVTDSVDAPYGDEWIGNIREACSQREPDMLIVHHMEPDHSSNIMLFMTAFPRARIVSSQKAFDMMKNYFGTDFEDRRTVIREGDRLSLGRHELSFFAAPMVHWPEVMVSLDRSSGILFSADAFGKFGTQNADEDWACEARRYYFGIVGKFGAQVQALLKKLAGEKISVICPLHGPVLKENLGYYLDLYDRWSRYEPEDKGVTVAFTTVYGHTKAAAELLKSELERRGQKAELFDLARCDMAEAMEDAFRYDRLVLATTTYNGGIFPFMDDFVRRLVEHNFQKRTVAFIENGSWAPMAAKTMAKMLEGCRELNILPETVTVRSALNDDSRAAISALADALSK